MTLNATPNSYSADGNGVTTVFTLPFQIQTAADLYVNAVDIATGGELGPYYVNQDYTLSGIGSANTTLTLTSPLAVGARLKAWRDPANDQPTSYTPGDPFPAKTHEAALDHLAMQIARLKDRVDRMAYVPDLSTGSTAGAPEPVEGSLLGWVAGRWQWLLAAATDLSAALLGTGLSQGDALIKVVQPYTGAATRTQHDKNAEQISVLDFGADPTGATDSSAAIAKALQAATKTVLFPCGIYRADADIVVPDGVSIKGDGQGSTTIRLKGNGLGDNVKLQVGSRTTVESLTICETGATGRTGVYGVITGFTKTDVRIRDVEVYGGSSTGMMFVTCSRVVVESCYVHDTYADGIHSQRGSTDVSVVNCIMERVSDDGIAFVSHGYNTYGRVMRCLAQGNTIRDTAVTGSGVASVGAVDVRIIGNTIYNVPLSGIRCTAFSVVGEGDCVGGHITIALNNIRKAGAGASGERSGIYLDGVRYVSVDTNDVYDTGTSGIAVSTGWADISLKNNTVAKTGDVGVFVSSAKNTNYYTQMWTDPLLEDGFSLSYVSGHSIDIINNLIRSTSSTGILAVGPSSAPIDAPCIKDNRLYRIKTSSAGSAYGVNASYTSNLMLSGNFVSSVNALAANYSVTNSTLIDGVHGTNLPLESGLLPTATLHVGEATLYVNGSAPSSGTYKLGDFVFNWNPASGVFGWTCTSAGSPGTWAPVNVN